MNSIQVVKILKEVPECHLRLVSLAWKVVGDDGSIDAEQVAFYSKEVAEATDEVEAYRKATAEAVRCLMSLFPF